MPDKISISPWEMKNEAAEIRYYGKKLSQEEISTDFKISLDVYNNLNERIEIEQLTRTGVVNETFFVADVLESIANIYEEADAQWSDNMVNAIVHEFWD